MLRLCGAVVCCGGVLHSGKTGFRIADNATTTMESVDYAKPKSVDILGLLIQYIHKYLKIGVQFVATYEYIMYKAIHISMQWVMEPGFRYEIYFNQLEKFEAAKAA